MSNLSALMQGNGVELAENVEYVSMTESDMANLLTVAIQEAILEGVSEEVCDPEEDKAITEGTLPEDMAVLETSIVRLDKAAKKQRAYKLAILQVAKDEGQKDYKKLETLWRMEKYLFRRLEKKNQAKARARMHQTAKKASGNNGIVKRAKSLLTRSQRETNKALAGDIKPPSQVKSQFKTITQKLSSKVS